MIFILIIGALGSAAAATTIIPTTNTVLASGGIGFSVSVSSSTSWTASSSASWVTITAGASGSGYGSVTYNVDANTSATSRSATITIGGQVLTINQAGATATIGAPTASTNSASGIGNTAATLNGNVTPNGLATSAYFEYGPTTAYGSTAPSPSFNLGSGSTGVGVSQPISGLSPGTTYHFQLIASNSDGTTYAGDQTFTTSSSTTTTITPTTNTVLASGGIGFSVSVSSSTSWTASSSASWVTITAGASGSGYGSVTYNVDANTSATSRSATITIGGQVLTINQAGATATIGAPTASTNSASGIGNTAATLNGNVTPNGLATSAYFEYGPTTAYGSTAPSPSFNLGSGSTGVGVSQPISGLSPGTTYHFQLIASNSDGTTYAGDQTFTTSSSTTTTITPTTNTVLASGGIGFSVSVSSSTSWTASSSASWVTITAGASGSGYGSVTYNVDANTSATSRSATITIGGQVLTINQAGATATIGAPTASTNSASGIGNTAATLNGNVTPNGLATSAYFEYGPTTAYGSTAPSPSFNLGSGSTGVGVSQPISGLSPGTTYHFQLIASNSDGTTYAGDQTFTTSSSTTTTITPTTNTVLASGGIGFSVSVSSSTSWTASSSASWVTITAGASGSGYGSVTYNVDANTSATSRSATITIGGQVLTINQAGATATIGAPTASTNSASGIGNTAATLNGNVTPNGLATSAYFEYGPTTAYGSTAPSPSFNLGSGSTGVGVSQPISGLSPGTTYHFQLIASNSDGTTYAGDQTFTTSSSTTTTITPTTNTVLASGGIGFSVSVSSSTSWTASSSASWVTITAGASGSGYGSVTYNVDANTSATSRSATITIGGQVLTINQAGATATIGAPTASTNSASGIGNTAATLNGNVTPNGLATSAYFEYGPTTAYGSTAPSPSFNLGSGSTGVGVSQPISGLSPGTTYHFQLIASNSDGTTYAGDQTFTTSSSTTTTITPTTNTVLASGGIGFSVSVSSSTSWTASSSASWVTITAGASGSGNGSVTYNVDANTSATSRSATITIGGQVLTINQLGAKATIGAPTASTNGASGVGNTAATLNGNVTPNGLATSAYFEYGPTTAYGSTAPSPSINLGSGSTGVGVSQPISGLSPGTTYHFQLVASNSDGTTYGADATFTATVSLGTPSVPAPTNGEVLNSQPISLSWAPTTGAISYNVYLSAGGGTYNEVGANLSSPQCPLNQNYSATTFSWYVVAVGSAGVTTQGPTWSFTIGSPLSITILAPTGSETWTAGTAQTISWSVAGSAASVAQFNVQLSSNGGTSFTSLTAGNLPSASSRSWTWSIPANLSGSNARIRVQALDASGVVLAYATNAGAFAIAMPAAVGALQGVVLSSSGLAISAASVSVGTTAAQTDSNGNYTLTGLQPGSATVLAQKTGYVAVQRSANVTANSSTTVNFVLNLAVPTGTTPTVLNVSSRWFSSGKHVYYLNGVSLVDTIIATVDWNGLTPGTIVWITPSGPVTENQFTADVGNTFGVGGKLKVQAVAANGAASPTVTANFDVIPSPIPSSLLSPDLGSIAGSVLRYGGSTPQVGSPVLVDVEEPSEAVPSSIPVFGGNAYQFAPAPVLSWTVNGDGTAAINSPNYSSKPNFLGKKIDLSGSVSASFIYAPSAGFWAADGGSATLQLDLAITSGPYYQVIPIGPIPVPVYESTQDQLELNSTLSLQGLSNSNPQWTGDINFVPSISGTVGAGVSGVLNVEGTLSGALTMDVGLLPQQKINQLSLSITGSVSATEFIFQQNTNLFSANYDFLTKQLTEHGLSLETNPTHHALAKPMLTGRLDLSSFKLAPRTYLNPHHIRSAASIAARPRRITDTSAPTNVHYQSVYPWSQPKLLNLGTQLIMGWITDNPGQSSINRTQFVTMVQTVAGWSTPQAVWSDGSPDFQPALAVTPTGAIAIWAKTNAPLPGSADLATMTAAMGIAVAKYNTLTSTWSNPLRLSQTQYLNRNPMIASAPDGTALAAWIANPSNDLLGSASTPNQIFFSKWDGSSWSVPTMIASGLGAIVKADLAYNGQNALLVYSLDADSDLSTNNDRNLCGMSWNGTSWSAPFSITNDTMGNDQPKLTYTPSGDLLLFWSRGNGIAWVRNENYGQIQMVVQTGQTFGLADFALASGPGTLAVVWEGASADGPDLWSSVFDPVANLWGLPQQLTDDSNLKRSSSACFDSGGNLNIAFDQVPVVLAQGSGAGNTLDDNNVELCTLTTPITGDLAIGSGDISLSDPNPSPGEPITISATVHNIGKLTASGVVMAFYDGDPSNGGTQIDQQPLPNGFASGDSITVAAAWVVPKSLSSRSIFVVIDPKGAFPDANRANNTASIQYMAPALVAQYISAERVNPNLLVLTARMENQGGLPTGATSVNFCVGSPTGTLVGTVPIATIAPRSYQDVQLQWTPNGEPMASHGWLVYAIANEQPNSSVSTLISPDAFSPITLVSAASNSSGVTLTISAPKITPSSVVIESASTLNDPVAWAIMTNATISTDSSGNLIVSIPPGVGGPYYRAFTQDNTYTYYTVAAAVSNPSTSQLVNISARAYLGTGPYQNIVAGFYTDGLGSKNLVIRGVGPGLVSVDSALSGQILSNPKLTLFNGSTATLATNTAWGGGQTLINAFASVYAFPLQPNSDDTAVFMSVPAGSGIGYTAEVDSLNSSAGIALVEVYDYDSFTGTPASNLINISTRAFVGPGNDVLVAGFWTIGGSSQTVLIRAVGPGLASFDSALSGLTLANPTLTLYDSTGAVIATNVGWGNAPVLGNSTVAARIQPATTAIMNEVYASPIAVGSADCAMVVTLPPGGYTAQVSGVGSTTGVALVEVYKVP